MTLRRSPVPDGPATCEFCGASEARPAPPLHTFHGFLVCPTCKRDKAEYIKQRRVQLDEEIRNR